MSVVSEYRDLRIRVEPPYHAVEAAVQAPVPAQDAWRAIADPPQVGRWFGTLRPGFVCGAPARLDFGDGDFFELSVRRVEQPRLLEYSWRFLGTAPENLITWRIEPLGECACEISVADVEPERTRDEALALATGWADFFGRLSRFLQTGAPARYDWREDVDATIELPTHAKGARTLLAQDVHARWLPVGEDGLVPGSAFAVEEDDPLEVHRLERVDPDTIRMTLGRAGWEEATSCVIGLAPRSRDTLLEVHHTGFRSVPLDDEGQKRLRTHVTRTWITALERARAAVAIAAGA
jgi:uncharacterized protein YndB with AHSA1/START domain